MQLTNGKVERYVLSGILEDPTVLAEADVQPDWFADQHNKKIFKHILNLEVNGEEVNPFNLFLNIDGQLELTAKEISSIGATPTRTLKAVEKLKEMATRRKLIQAGNQIISDAKEEVKLSDVCSRAEELILNATGESLTSADWYDMEELLQDFHEHQEQLAENEGIPGISTGIERLDKITLGMQDDTLILLGGRPSMGKSTLALNIALNAARNDNRVLFFSVEMSKRQLMNKVVAHLGRIPNQTLMKGIDMDNDDLDRKYMKAYSKAMTLPLHINDQGGISVAEIASISRRVKRKEGLDLVIVDYAQRISADRIEGMSDATVMKQICGGLANMAKAMGIPVLCLSQLNRSLEHRKDKRPRMADLRESGDLEQDAFAIWFVYRHGHYYPEKCERKGISTVTEVIVRKNRMGPKGKVLLDFEAPFDTFKEVSSDQYARYKQAF